MAPVVLFPDTVIPEGLYSIVHVYSAEWFVEVEPTREPTVGLVVFQGDEFVCFHRQQLGRVRHVVIFLQQRTQIIQSFV